MSSYSSSASSPNTALYNTNPTNSPVVPNRTTNSPTDIPADLFPIAAFDGHLPHPHQITPVLEPTVTNNARLSFSFPYDPHHHSSMWPMSKTPMSLPPLKNWNESSSTLVDGMMGKEGPAGEGVRGLNPPLSRYYVDGPVPVASQSEHPHPAPSSYAPPPPSAVYYDDHPIHYHPSSSTSMSSHHHRHNYTIPPPSSRTMLPLDNTTTPTTTFVPGHSARSSISSLSSTSTAASSPPSSNPSPPLSSIHSPELRMASSPPKQLHPPVTLLDDPSEDASLNLIAATRPAADSKGAAAAPGGSSASIFECPGCDLTFTRLSALKQHMLSHTGEKPHACDHCGRRFSLASNLRRHTTTKACKVLKFQSVKETLAAAVSSVVPSAASPPSTPPAPTPVAQPSSPAKPATPPAPTPTPIAAPAATMTPVPKDGKKRKATNDTPTASKPPTQRRKRHANQEARWIPRTLALFKNAHLLTSTPPFQFCIYRAKPTPTPVDEDPEPFTRPTLPLHPVRPGGGGVVTGASRASVRSVVTSDSASTHSSASSSEEHDSDTEDTAAVALPEERDSYDCASEYPYHPASWLGRLPGPGLLSGDELVKNPSIARRWMNFKR